MSVERLELSTNGLKGRCSTIELHTLGRGGFEPPSDIPETRVAGTSARHCIIPPFQRQSLDHGSSGLYHIAHGIPTNPIKIIPESPPYNPGLSLLPTRDKSHLTAKNICASMISVRSLRGTLLIAFPHSPILQHNNDRDGRIEPPLNLKFNSPLRRHRGNDTMSTFFDLRRLTIIFPTCSRSTCARQSTLWGQLSNVSSCQLTNV